MKLHIQHQRSVINKLIKGKFPESFEHSVAGIIDDRSDSPRRLTLHNTGGWLKENGRFCGAEIFTYDSTKGFSSFPIK